MSKKNTWSTYSYKTKNFAVGFHSSKINYFKNGGKARKATHIFYIFHVLDLQSPVILYLGGLAELVPEQT